MRSFMIFLTQIAKLLKSKRNDNLSDNDHLGHSSHGSLSVIVLLLLTCTQVATGLFNTDDYTFAPLSGLVDDSARLVLSEIHTISFDVLCCVIGLHILAIIYYRLKLKRTLTSSMLSGKKSSARSDLFISDSRLMVALIIMIVSITIVYATINCCSDSIPVGEFDF